MGLQINTNVAAMNAYRNLNGTQGAMATSLERLSSGLRINRAADDAAGLAISEKLRGQINGLRQASANAQDGISLIQTAEGALNESHAILQRMRQLAVQAANDTNTDADRAQIQKEVDQLSKELSRIGSTTQFNGKNLLNGDLTATPLSLQIGANAGQNLSVSVGDVRGYALGMAGSASYLQSATVTTAPAAGDYTVVGDGGTGYNLLDSSGTKVGTSADGKTFKDLAATPATTFVFADAVTSGTVTSDGTNVTANTKVANTGLQAGDYTVSGTSVLDSSGNKIGTYDTASFDVSIGGTVVANFGQNVTKFSVGGVDVSTRAAASTAITTADGGVSKISDQRSTLGAVQNRLQHTINNLGVAAENLTASESRIRDTDMAKEMTAFTRAQILQQAGISMLAQANAAPQSVLKLLG